MIKITVELVSAIHPSRSKVLGAMTIANKGTSEDSNYGDYEAKIWRSPSFKEVTRSGSIVRWPRKSKVVWLLVLKMLEILYKENKHAIQRDEERATVSSNGGQGVSTEAVRRNVDGFIEE